MPLNRKGSTNNLVPKSAELAEAEAEAKEAMRAYFGVKRGRQAAVCRATAIPPPLLCRIISKPEYPVGLEFAVLIEVATDGALPVEVLCPSRAEVFGKLLALRAREVEAEAA